MSEPNLASSQLAAEGSHLDLHAQPGVKEQASVQEQPCGQQLMDTVTLNATVDRSGDGAGTRPTTDSQDSDSQDSDSQRIEPFRRSLDEWADQYRALNTIAPGFLEALLQQSTLALEVQRQQWAHEQAVLEAELRQTRSLSYEQIERIRHLEQALDQSLASLSEMRLQVVDQHLLEAQLASTEDISNIQQRAIARLKLQLSQQQQALSAQLTEMQVRDRSVQTLVNTMKALTEAEQQTLQQLQRQIADDWTEVQAYQQHLTQQEQAVVEDQSLDAPAVAARLIDRLAQTHAQVSAVSQTLSDRQGTLQQLEAELQQPPPTLREPLQQTHSPQSSVASHSSLMPVVPNAAPEAAPVIAPALAAAHTKIAALEAQAAKQTTTQAMLRHACQELEEERDRQQVRLTELEHQTTDMQEQILRQAQQMNEYETAIQHWKDRCFSSQGGLLKLKELLDKALPDAPAELAALLAALLATADETEPGSPTLLPTTSFQREKVDLPEFLLRRRNYKARRS